MAYSYFVNSPSFGYYSHMPGKHKVGEGHMGTSIAYLLHFDTPIYHAQHYLGSCNDLSKRILRHKKGQGARLTQVCIERGIAFRVVRTWKGDRKMERKLKNRKNGRKLCPICDHFNSYK